MNWRYVTLTMGGADVTDGGSVSGEGRLGRLMIDKVGLTGFRWWDDRVAELWCDCVSCDTLSGLFMSLGLSVPPFTVRGVDDEGIASCSIGTVEGLVRRLMSAWPDLIVSWSLSMYESGVGGSPMLPAALPKLSSLSFVSSPSVYLMHFFFRLKWNNETCDLLSADASIRTFLEVTRGNLSACIQRFQIERKTVKLIRSTHLQTCQPAYSSVRNFLKGILLSCNGVMEKFGGNELNFFYLISLSLSHKK